MRIKTFLACFFILVIRGWDRLLHPGIWAEDGTFFLNEALVNHWGAAFQAFQGYFHLFNFSAIALFKFFPLSLLPALITTLIFILYAWVMSLFADKSYRYLVNSDLSRVFITFGLCILPGSFELLGNLCNSHRILAVYFLFICLKPIQERFKLHELLISFFIMGSAGEVVVFLPLLIYRIYWRSQKQDGLNNKIKNIREEIILVSLMLGWTMINVASSKTNDSFHQYPDIIKTLNLTAAAFIFNFSIMPIVGWRLGENLHSYYRIVFWLVSIVFSFILLRDVWKSKNSSRFMIYLAVLCLCASQELSWIVRPGDATVYKDFYPSMWWGQTRLVFVLSFAGFFAWSTLTADRSKKWGIAFVVLYFVLANPLKVPAYGDVSYWPTIAAKLEQSIQTGCPKKVTVPIFPEGWSFTYIAQKDAEICHD